MPRFSETVPKTPLELEIFYLNVIKKVGGTDATLEEVDQRSTWPGASVASELERSIVDATKSITAPLRARIDDLERQLRNIQEKSTASKLDDLERRINSIEMSARF
jgi:hypothetical protein